MTVQLGRAFTLFLLLWVQNVFAAGVLFNVTSAGTPANVNLTLCLNGNGPLSCQQFTVTGRAISIQPTAPNHLYPNIGIKINTFGYSVGNLGLACTPNSNGFCLFSASNTAPKNLLITQTSLLYGYVADNLNTVWQCPINQSTGALSNTCAALNNGTAFNSVRGLTLKMFDNIYLYVADQSSNIWQCPIGGAGNFSTSCAALTNASPFVSTSSIAIHDFGGVTYGYVSDVLNDLEQCPMNSAGKFSGACSPLYTTGTTPISTPYSTTFHDFSDRTYAYVARQSANILRCAISPTDGTVSGVCGNLTTVTFNQVTGVTFRTFAGVTYGYVTDKTRNVSQCLMTAVGTLSSCVRLPIPDSSATLISTTFGVINGTTYAYLTDNSTHVWQCPMSASGGFSGGCTALTKNPAYSETAHVEFDAIN